MPTLSTAFLTGLPLPETRVLYTLLEKCGAEDELVDFCSSGATRFTLFVLKGCSPLAEETLISELLLERLQAVASSVLLLFDSLVSRLLETFSLCGELEVVFAELQGEYSSSQTSAIGSSPIRSLYLLMCLIDPGAGWVLSFSLGTASFETTTRPDRLRISGLDTLSSALSGMSLVE